MSYEQVTPTNLADVLLLEPKVLIDERGFFLESFNQRDFEEAIRKSVNFVQDNHSCSQRGVLRGLHFQIKKPQGKLISVIKGEIFDVAVDLRKNSKTFGKSFKIILISKHLDLIVSNNFFELLFIRKK